MTSNFRKIAVVIPKYGLVGGGEKFAFELTERIALNPLYEVHVFANKWRTGSKQITFHKIPIITFPKFLTTISFAYFANHEISKMNFDLIHTHERIFNADIFTMHGIPHQIWVKEVRKKRMSLFDYGTRWVEKRLVKNSSRFLSVSKPTKEKFIREYNICPDDVQIIHPGVNINKFKNVNLQRREEIRSRFGIEETDIVILFVGMNFEIKGLDSLMEAVAITKSKYPPPKLKLLVVGKGNEKKYQKLAGRLGIKDDVRFAGVWKDNIESLYRACDMFSILSKFDTFAMTVLEAMAGSLPVIISNNVGAKDLICEGINGFVVNTEDIGAVSSKIALLLDTEKRKNMAQEAHKTALQNIWDVATKSVLNVYEEILTAS